MIWPEELLPSFRSVEKDTPWMLRPNLPLALLKRRWREAAWSKPFPPHTSPISRGPQAPRWPHSRDGSASERKGSCAKLPTLEVGVLTPYPNLFSPGTLPPPPPTLAVWLCECLLTSLSFFLHPDLVLGPEHGGVHLSFVSKNISVWCRDFKQLLTQ